MKTSLMHTPSQFPSSLPVTRAIKGRSKASRVLLLGIAIAVMAMGLRPAAAQNAYYLHNLVSDLPGTADFTDPNLVNPWGIAFSSTGPFWISDNLTGLSTIYNSSGTPQALVVTIPPPAGGAGPTKPTGIVFNSTTNFSVASNAVARFIFATEGGTIAGWNSGTGAVVKVDNSAAGAIYKGLAIGNSGGSNYLYAANFHAGAVEVYDANYNRAALAGSFNDPSIPAGFAPFNIQNLGGQLFVAYAKQDTLKTNDIPGAGNGYLTIFDQSGNFVKRLVSSGVLDSPWGLAIAPADFGAFSGAVLVGNFGNGQINAFDSQTGTYLGTLQDQSANPISILGLWGLIVGNGGSGGDGHTLYFAAGIPGTGAIQSHGLFGSIFSFRPSLTQTTDKGVAAALSWAGGAAPFLVQKKASLQDSNWVNLLTTTSRSPMVAKESQSGFFRVQSLATNTVLPFTVSMNGASEVPAVANTSATAAGAFSLQGSNLSYYISFSGLSGPATAAHLHAPANATNAAGVMVPLNPPAAATGIMSGVLTLTEDQITNFVTGLCYANIHTTLNPGGEIRGQVVPLHIAMTLNAASEVPVVTNAPNATATGSLTFVGSELSYSIAYSGLSAPATAAHIHGPAGPTNAASVIVPLTTPSGTSGSISGTASLTPTELAYLLSGSTYINIHTTNNPGGEIRGQIWPLQFHANLNAVSEVPSTASPAIGSGSISIANNILNYNFTFNNLLSAATAGHIHGPADSSHNAGVIIPFTVPAAASGSFSGSVALTSQELFYILSGQTYANIHTTNYPGGEIRGQLVPNN
jgi:uncharacterized protein (TIGR03118 family)